MVMMNSQIETSTRGGILEISGTCPTGMADYGLVLHDVTALLDQCPPAGVLLDLRLWRERPSTTATYWQVWTYPPSLRRVPIAVVDHKEHEAISSSHENTAANRGFLIWHFNEIDQARDWLMSQVGASKTRERRAYARVAAHSPIV
jgi:hypothetical protein